MGRSSQQDAARNRVRIVEAASRLFRRHGVEGVSIADVMGAAGMTTGGFYKHFASREALVDEALALAFDQSAASWRAACARRAADIPSGPQALVEHYLKRRSPDRTCPMLAFGPYVASTGAGGSSTALYGKSVEALFEQFVEQVRHAGAEKGSAALGETDAMLLFAAMIGAGLLSRAAGDTAWTAELRETVRRAAQPRSARARPRRASPSRRH